MSSQCYCNIKLKFQHQELQLDILDRSDGELEFQHAPKLVVKQNNFIIKMRKSED